MTGRLKTLYNRINGYNLAHQGWFYEQLCRGRSASPLAYAGNNWNAGFIAICSLATRQEAHAISNEKNSEGQSQDDDHMTGKRVKHSTATQLAICLLFFTIVSLSSLGTTLVNFTEGYYDVSIVILAAHPYDNKCKHSHMANLGVRLTPAGDYVVQPTLRR